MIHLNQNFIFKKISVFIKDETEIQFAHLNPDFLQQLKFIWGASYFTWWLLRCLYILTAVHLHTFL